jgi:hypothetical protein
MSPGGINLIRARNWFEIIQPVQASLNKTGTSPAGMILIRERNLFVIMERVQASLNPTDKRQVVPQASYEQILMKLWRLVKLESKRSLQWNAKSKNSGHKNKFNWLELVSVNMRGLEWKEAIDVGVGTVK